MRRVDWLVGLGALLAAAGGSAALLSLGACNADFGTCTTFPHAPGCLGYSLATSSSSSGSTSSGSSTSSTSSSSSGMMPTCMGDPTADAGLVSDMCGIFVSATASDAGTATGTMENPFNNLADALVAAQQNDRFIFVCAGKYTLPGTLSIKQGVDIYGNVGCTGGMWSLQDPTMEANRAELDGPANSVAVVVSTTAGVVNISGLNVVAADATGMGASSVAVYVDTGTTANFTNSDITSGMATDGAAGMDAPTTAAAAGTNGSNGNAACSAVSVQGATQVTNTCSATVMSVGGQGGNGALGNGTAASPGLPAATATGVAGAGDNGTTGWNCAANGGNGTAGGPGTNGMAGMPATGFGTLMSTGYVGISGGDGADGTPGQGGGGGGGVRGSSSLCTGANNGGASGGSGASGGCGGAGGQGGKGGGSSVALVSVSATVTLSSVKLIAGPGGAGGRGGNLQGGGLGGSAGGTGGTPVGSLSAGCSGGTGGQGGAGGPGAGGNGGHSLAIASQGTAPIMGSNTTTMVASTPAAGGPGGSNNSGTNPGNAGQAAPCWDFMKNMACQ
jgi:hypothetical protein